MTVGRADWAERAGRWRWTGSGKTRLAPKQIFPVGYWRMNNFREIKRFEMGRLIFDPLNIHGIKKGRIQRYIKVKKRKTDKQIR